MEDKHDKPAGKPLYILSEDDYGELCNIRTMLIQMAQTIYDEDRPSNARETLPLTRAETYFFLMEISLQISDALEGVRRGKYIGPPRGAQN
jgi:hypothetical protein